MFGVTLSGLTHFELVRVCVMTGSWAYGDWEAKEFGGEFGICNLNGAWGLIGAWELQGFVHCKFVEACRSTTVVSTWHLCLNRDCENRRNFASCRRDSLLEALKGSRSPTLPEFLRFAMFGAESFKTFG